MAVRTLIVDDSRTMQQLVKLMALNLRTLGKGSEVAEILDN